jgi:arylsulfatase A-like enzyme
LDALRADRVHAQRNGVPLMPYLSHLAEESVRFTHAVTPCTWTRPAMASIFTSLYVDTHQVYFSTDPRNPEGASSDALPASFETMASYLKKAGYFTAEVQTNGNLVPELGFAQGFDQYEYLPEGIAGDVTARALERVQTLREPFFFYVHYLDPHFPYTPPEEYRKLLGWPPPLDETELKIVSNYTDYFWDYADYLIGNKPAPTFPPLSEAARDAVRTLYDGEVRYLDDQFGKLLDVLRAKWKNTLIIILADHGEHFWEHGFVGHGLTMYEEERRVPFFMLGPSLAPRDIAGPVETLDILPTIADVLGLAPNPGWQGKSLFAQKGKARHDPVFSYTRGPWAGCHTDVETVEVGDLKLISNRAKNQLELYDLGSDPREKTNRVAEQPKAVEQLQALLDAHRQANVQARGQTQRRPVRLPEEVLQQLKSLGYLP